MLNPGDLQLIVLAAKMGISKGWASKLRKRIEGKLKKRIGE